MDRTVIDIYHENAVTDIKAVRAAGVLGVIHKASEALSADPLYDHRRGPFTDVGMLWGAYHFMRPGDMQKQADFFVKAAAPDEHTLLAADHEDARVSLVQLRQFIMAVEKHVGRQMVVYSGNVAKEQWGRASGELHGFFSARRLWLAQYGAKPTTPQGWPLWLWQFSGDGLGPQPHTCPGIADECDNNSYSGKDLAGEWAGAETGATT